MRLVNTIGKKILLGLRSFKNEFHLISKIWNDEYPKSRWSRKKLLIVEKALMIFFVLRRSVFFGSSQSFIQKLQIQTSI